MNWQSEFTFGKHEGVSLTNVLIIDKAYLKWAYEEEMHLTRPEIEFIFDNIKESELREIQRS